MTVQSRAHRIPRHLDWYGPLGPDDVQPEGLPRLGPGESWVGLYRNDPASLQDALAFSSRGLYVRQKADWRGIGYADVMEAPVVGGKSDAREIEIETPSGASTAPVRGGDDRIRDSFEVLRFLDRVAEDVRTTSGAQLRPEPAV